MYEASYDSYGTDYNQVQIWVGSSAGSFQWENSISVISTPATKTTTTFQFRAQATSGYVNFRGNVDVGSGVAYFDNISVRKVLTAFNERGAELVVGAPADASGGMSIVGDTIVGRRVLAVQIKPLGSTSVS